jgi:hypothetical protein
MMNNAENKKSVLSNVNQKHLLPRQEYMSMCDRDQADVLEKLLSAGHNRNFPEEMHLPQPPSHTSSSSSLTYQPLPYNPNNSENEENDGTKRPNSSKTSITGTVCIYMYMYMNT